MSQTVTFTDANAWQAATELVVTEEFDDDELVTGLGVETDNGSIVNGVFNDTVNDPDNALIIIPQAPAITTWSYSTAPTAWSTDFDLSPGGPGSDLDILVTYTDNSTESLGTFATSGFIGIVSDARAISQIQFSTVASNNSTQEQYNLDNFASGFATTAVPEPSATTLLSLGSALLFFRRRRVTN